MFYRSFNVVMIIIILSLFACVSNPAGRNYIENQSKFAEPLPASPDSMLFSGRASECSNKTPNEESTATAQRFARDNVSAVSVSSAPAAPIKEENNGKSLFIDLDHYTTDGAIYQQKYKSSLQNIINILLNNNMVIKEESVGFYFDRRSNNRKKLYVGLDLIIENTSGGDYGLRAKGVLRSNLKNVLDTINSHRELFKEEQVIGIVIGFLWTNVNINEQVNIWVQSSDAERYKNNELTLEETVQRSFLTNAQGKIIILR